jgi:hypothetical protein
MVAYGDIDDFDFDYDNDDDEDYDDVYQDDW